MRNLETIFLLDNSEDPHLDLDLTMEALMDGNSGNAHQHLLRLVKDELSQIQSEKVPQTFIRFSGISNKKGYQELKKDITQGRITFGNPFKFNDPMDPIIKIWMEMQKNESWTRLDKKFFKAAKNTLKNLRICCFSDKSKLGNNIPLMWSHYADSHKGIAIKYKISEESINKHNDEEHVLRLCKVPYRKYKAMSDYITIDNALLAKGACWEYEAEHRLVYFSTNDNEFKIKDEDSGKESRKDYISLEGFNVEAIYLGTKIDSQKESELIALARQRHIDVFKMKYDKNDITRLVENPI